MSHAAPAPFTIATSKVARLTHVVRRSWSQARLTDRQLMELRTNLSRHAG
jgi:hypothetical protein